MNLRYYDKKRCRQTVCHVLKKKTIEPNKNRGACIFGKHGKRYKNRQDYDASGQSLALRCAICNRSEVRK